MKTESRGAEPDRSPRRLDGGLLKLYRACLRNAEELLKEAELLLENGHFARAFALGFTAYEEVGKSQIVADRFNNIVSQDEFDKAFQSHTLKAAYVGRHIQLPDGAVVYDREALKANWRLRLAALYVERGADNKPQIPSEAVSRESATDVIERVREELEAIRHAEWLNQRIGTKGLFK